MMDTQIVFIMVLIFIGKCVPDEMKLLKDHNVDPLRECLEVFSNETIDSDLDLYSKGMIVFFHGSPCEGKS